ncbi:MAG: S41 family peptidase [Bacteroidales bacterium]|nr:S41 family peptidase [Bacteroidales bacterium]
MRKNLFFIAVLILALSSCQCNKQREIENIKAFSTVYGLLRWFHPSDEAQQIDWNQFALYGVHEVAGCRSEQELQKKLEELFLPIAPTISFTQHAEEKNTTYYTPSDTSGMLPIAWQHYGVKSDYYEKSSYVVIPYTSARTNRQENTATGILIAGDIIPDEYKGKKIKIQIRYKIAEEDTNFKVYLLLKKCYKDDNISNVIPLDKTGEWKDYERISSENHNDTRDWYFCTKGSGCLYLRHITLSFLSDGKWEIFQTINSNNITPYLNDPREHSYEYTTTASGDMKISVKDLLFEQLPSFGEYTHWQIGEHLYVHVPLVLYGDKYSTYPQADTLALQKLKTNLAKHATETSGSNRMSADIVVAWNVMKYFHPYLAELAIDWDKELSEALKQINAKSKDFSTLPLDLMLAKLEDGHIFWTAPYPTCILPFIVKKINNEIVVINPLDSTFCRGDVIKTINGQSALQRYEMYEARISGSADVKNDRARVYWNEGYRKGEPLTVQAIRNGKALQVSTTTVSWRWPSPFDRPQTGMINDSTLYVNMSTIKGEYFQELTTERTPNLKIIFDMREAYSLSGDFNSLISKKNELYRRSVFLVPEVIYPHTPQLHDTLSTIPHRVSNRNIFITGVGNQSHHETLLDWLRYHGIACLVGQHTAGANGTINYLSLPSGTTVSFTGMKYLSHSGKDYYYYRKGIQPDYPVEGTIEDIKAGRDAALEKALEIAKEPVY